MLPKPKNRVSGTQSPALLQTKHPSIVILWLKKNKAEDNLIITPTPPLWFPRKRAKRASRKKTQSCLPKKGDISIMVPFLLLQNIIINMHGGKKKTVIKSVNYSASLKNL